MYCIHPDDLAYIVIYSSKTNDIYYKISWDMYIIIADFCPYIHIGPVFLPTHLPTYRALQVTTNVPLLTYTKMNCHSYKHAKE